MSCHIAKVIGIALLLSACADERAGGENAEDTPAELGLGAWGPEAKEVNRFLLASGYLPNPELEKLYPDWLPVIDQKLSSDSRFEPATVLAVKQLQSDNGLPPTGVVDAATRNVMTRRTCGAPETKRFEARSGEKYALYGRRYTKTNITFAIQTSGGPLNISPDYFSSQLRNAMSTVAGITNLNMQEVATNAAPDILLMWDTSANVDQGGSFIARHYNWPNLGGTIGFDAGEAWAEDNFLWAVAMHETGHALGIDHSSMPACPYFGRCAGFARPVMSPDVQRILTEDDVTAFSVSYPRFEQVPGCARDVASATYSTWVIGCDPQPGGYGIWTYVNGGWTNVPGGAVRIAVDPNSGVPWAVNDQGSIYYGSTSGTDTQFTPFSGGGCATDIAVKTDGLPWVIGCDASPGGYGIWEYVQNSGWRQEPGAAVNISLDKYNMPWVVNSSNEIYRTYLTSGFVQQPGYGRDIAVNQNGSPWLVGMDDSVWSFSEQNESGTAPFHSGWEPAPGVSVQRIAADFNDVWVVQDGGNIYRMKISLPLF